MNSSRIVEDGRERLSVPVIQLDIITGNVAYGRQGMPRRQVDDL